jgi:SSS family solute:Na+ symporter
MNRFSLTLPDVLVIAGYFLVVIWIGLEFRNRVQAPGDYFAGGHQVPWWLAGISHYMSSFSAFSFVAYAQLGYTWGWVSITLFWVTVPACMLGGLVFARRWRQARVITPVEFLERRFNNLIRQLFAWAGVPMKLFEDGLKIFATSLFLASSIGISVKWAIVACGGVTIFYTLLGGLWALVVTDYVQFLMKSLAMLLLFPLAIWRAGGLRHAFANAPPAFFHPVNGPYNWIYLLGFAVLIAMSYNGSWSLAQKYYSVRDTREASKAAYLSAALNFIGAPIMILPAMIGRQLLPDLIAQHRTADAYVLLILKVLPAGMVGVIIAALLSATMATVSSDFNSIAGVLTQDVYHRLLRPNASARQLVRIGRLITMVVGSLSVGCGLWIAFSGQQSLLELMVTVAGVFLAPSYLPLLAALVSRRLTWKGALLGYIFGIASGVSMLALRFSLQAHHDASWMRAFDGITILLNTSLTIAGMWVGSRFLHSAAGERGQIETFFQEFDEPVIRTAEGAGPGAALAKTTIAMGVLLAAAALLTPALEAKAIDFGVAAILVAIGWLMWSRTRRTAPPIATPSMKDAVR